MMVRTSVLADFERENSLSAVATINRAIRVLPDFKLLTALTARSASQADLHFGLLPVLFT